MNYEPDEEEIAYSLAWVDKQDPRPSLSTEHGRYAIILAAAYREATARIAYLEDIAVDDYGRRLGIVE